MTIEQYFLIFKTFVLRWLFFLLCKLSLEMLSFWHVFSFNTRFYVRLFPIEDLIAQNPIFKMLYPTQPMIYYRRSTHMVSASSPPSITPKWLFISKWMFLSILKYVTGVTLGDVHFIKQTCKTKSREITYDTGCVLLLLTPVSGFVFFWMYFLNGHATHTFLFHNSPGKHLFVCIWAESFVDLEMKKA